MAHTKTGIELIAEERQSQIEKHKFDAARDAQYRDRELQRAAVYAITGGR